MMIENDKKPVYLRIVADATDSCIAGNGVRIEDVESGRELANVYRVVFEADASGICQATVSFFPVAVNIAAPGYAVPNSDVIVEPSGQEQEYVRIPLAEGARRKA